VVILVLKDRPVSVVKRATQVPKVHKVNKALQDKLSLLTTKVNKALKAQLDHVVKKAIKETLVKLAQWDHRV
jgi:hypothetical protein